MEEAATDAGAGGIPDVLWADVDVGTFRLSTLSFLDVVGKHVAESGSILDALVAINRWAEKNVTPEMNDTLMEDILHRRNREVIRHLAAALPLYDTVIIPWGALHMVEIEEAVLERGFVLQEEHRRRGINFRKLFRLEEPAPPATLPSVPR